MGGGQGRWEALRAAADAAQKLLAHHFATVGQPVEWFTPDHFEADDWPEPMAAYLALCDPDTVLALLADRQRVWEAALAAAAKKIEDDGREHRTLVGGTIEGIDISACHYAGLVRSLATAMPEGV